MESFPLKNPLFCHGFRQIGEIHAARPAWQRGARNDAVGRACGTKAAATVPSAKAAFHNCKNRQKAFCAISAWTCQRLVICLCTVLVSVRLVSSDFATVRRRAPPAHSGAVWRAMLRRPDTSFSPRIAIRTPLNPRSPSRFLTRHKERPFRSLLRRREPTP